MLYYIGAENASDIKCSSMDEFLQRIREAAMEAESKGQAIFEVSIEPEND